MSFLNVNSITTPVLVGSYQEEPREVGDEFEAFDGTVRRSRQSIKRDAAFELIPQLLADAWAWECLLQGRGEVWSFDSNLYGSKGTAPSGATTGCSIDAGVFKFASSLKIIANATPYSLTVAYNPGSNWTVCVWRKQGAGAWTHYVVTSEGKKWVDGVRNDGASTTWLSVMGFVQLIGDAADQVNYDDFVVLPYVVPTTWPPVWGVAASAFPLLPVLKLTGDALPDTTRNVIGGVKASSPVQKLGTVYRVVQAEVKET